MKILLALVCTTLMLGSAYVASAQHVDQHQDSMMMQMMHDTTMMRMMMDRIAADPKMRGMMMHRMMMHMDGDTAQMASMCGMMMHDPNMHDTMKKMACGHCTCSMCGASHSNAGKGTKKQPAARKKAQPAPKGDDDEHAGHH